MGWRRWGVVFVAGSVLIVVIALGFFGDRLKFFEPVGWLAGIVPMVAAVIALFARTAASAPQPIPATGPPTPSTAVDRLGSGLMTVSAMPSNAAVRPAKNGVANPRSTRAARATLSRSIFTPKGRG